MQQPAIQSGQFATLPNGTRLHFASAGQHGQPLILFLHGFPEYSGAWDEILPAFAPDGYAVAPDLRGYNLSSQPAEVAAYGMRELWGDIGALIGALGYERASLVGHDWGGAVAWHLAIARPEKVERLAILNSPHPMAFARELSCNPLQQAASAYINRLCAPGAESALSADEFRRLEGVLRSMARPDRPWLTPARLARYVQAWRHGLSGALNYYRASPLRAWAESSQAAAALHMDGRDFMVRVPTLVLWGLRDEALLPGLLDGLEQWVPDLTVQRLALATHWLVHEEPEFVTERLRAFLVR